jgi:hypothetical protein
MKGLLVLAGMAAAVALISGVLLVSAPTAPSLAPPAVIGPTGGPAGSAPAGRVVGPASPDLERRLRALEGRVDEILARLDARADSSVAPAAAVPALETPAKGTSPAAGPSSPTEEEWAAAARASSEAAADQGQAKEAKREAEVRRRLERAAAAMNLDASEKARFEEIVRAHLSRADDISARARDALRGSGYGFTQSERAAVETLEGDRRRLDQETEQSLVALVGPERWKQFLKSEKDQEAKERALKRFEKPW